MGNEARGHLPNPLVPGAGDTLQETGEMHAHEETVATGHNVANGASDPAETDLLNHGIPTHHHDNIHVEVSRGGTSREGEEGGLMRSKIRAANGSNAENSIVQDQAIENHGTRRESSRYGCKVDENPTLPDRSVKRGRQNDVFFPSEIQ